MIGKQNFLRFIKNKNILKIGKPTMENGNEDLEFLRKDVFSKKKSFEIF